MNRENLSKLLIPAFYAAAMTLVVLYSWNKQIIIRQKGSSPIYRNLMDGPAWIRKGFNPSELQKIPDPDTSWVLFESKPLWIWNAPLPDIPKRKYLSPWGTKDEVFTIIIPIEIDSEAIAFLNSNRTLLPGIFLAHIGDNWELFFNGTLIRSEMHLDETGRITSHRAWKYVHFPVDRSLIIQGTNTLAMRIVGDPTYYGTGVSFNAPHYMDDFAVIENRQFNFLHIAFCGIFGFSGVYYLMLFLSIKKKSEAYYLCFSIFSILLCVYSAMSNDLIRYVIPNSNITYRLEYASLMLLMPAFCMFIQIIGRGKVSKISWCYLAFCFLLVVTQFFFCYQYAEKALEIWNVSIFIYYSYVFFYDVIYFYFWNKKGLHKSAVAGESSAFVVNIITSTLLIYICGFYELVDALFLFTSYRLFQYSSFAVQIGMAITLSQRFSGMHKRLEQSNVILENTVKKRTVELEKQAAIAVQASLSKSEFLATMSHELKTPLTVISLHVQRAAELFSLRTPQPRLQTENDEKINVSLRRAQEEIMRVSRMTENALRLSSMQESSNQMKPLDMTPLLTTTAEAYRPLLEKNGNRLTVNIADKLPPVYGSADLLIQVMANLLSNANTHTKNGEISIKAETADFQWKSDNENGVYIVIKVIDNGSGISRELLPTLFERNVPGASGTGIGLSICKEIIASHNGTIQIESESGKGTSVEFKIPSAANAKEGKDAK